MPVNALNAALIGAVLENTPKNSNPAATVAEILNRGREAAYRRMRGEVPFTFGEAALVAARLSFSLDRIMGTDDPDCVLFRLDFSDGQTLLEDYPGKVESWIGKMEEIASDEQSEFSLAGSSLPAALYLGYEGLVRFRFFKCFFQHGMLDGANNRFDDMQLPPHVFDLSRRLRQAVRQIDTTYYVLDHSCFKHWVNAIRSFRAMRLISEGCVRELREELLRMLDELEEIALTGRFPDGRRVFLYISDVDLEGTYSYFVSQAVQSSGMAVFSVNSLRTSDPDMFARIKQWVLAMRRLSTLVSRSGELQRLRFFKEQRAVVSELDAE